ncbi:hypothetical protein J3F83DRAFT_741666 [Trichoderma novae-zelandiae]
MRDWKRQWKRIRTAATRSNTEIVQRRGHEAPAVDISWYFVQTADIITMGQVRVPALGQMAQPPMSHTHQKAIVRQEPCGTCDTEKKTASPKSPSAIRGAWVQPRLVSRNGPCLHRQPSCQRATHSSTVWLSGAWSDTKPMLSFFFLFLSCPYPSPSRRYTRYSHLVEGRTIVPGRRARGSGLAKGSLRQREKAMCWHFSSACLSCPALGRGRYNDSPRSIKCFLGAGKRNCSANGD